MKPKSLETTKKKRFIRQCPHCKSKKGYRVSYVIHGYGHEDKTFSGKTIDANRTVADDIDIDVVCLHCEKRFDTELVEHI